jgi:hypothetical protein
MTPLVPSLCVLACSFAASALLLSSVLCVLARPSPVCMCVCARCVDACVDMCMCALCGCVCVDMCMCARPVSPPLGHPCFVSHRPSLPFPFSCCLFACVVCCMPGCWCDSYLLQFCTRWCVSHIAYPPDQCVSRFSFNFSLSLVRVHTRTHTPSLICLDWWARGSMGCIDDARAARCTESVAFLCLLNPASSLRIHPHNGARTRTRTPYEAR